MDRSEGTLTVYRFVKSLLGTNNRLFTINYVVQMLVADMLMRAKAMWNV